MPIVYLLYSHLETLNCRSTYTCCRCRYHNGQGCRPVVECLSRQIDIRMPMYFNAIPSIWGVSYISRKKVNRFLKMDIFRDCDVTCLAKLFS